MLKIYRVDRGKEPVTETKLKAYKFGMTLEYDYYISGNMDKAFIGQGYQNVNDMSLFFKKFYELEKLEGFQFSEEQFNFHREVMQ